MHMQTETMQHLNCRNQTMVPYFKPQPGFRFSLDNGFAAVQRAHPLDETVSVFSSFKGQGNFSNTRGGKRV